MIVTKIALYLGGNGHAAVRLDAVRSALRPGIELIDVPYPGFEGRPASPSLDAFLDEVSQRCREHPEAVAVVASGIGAMVALGVRTRGVLVDTPLILQGPVLWGLERRAFPKLMQFPPLRAALRWAFTVPSFRRRFARKQFLAPQSPETLARFFDGYARCAAFGDFFRWFTPAYLRRLERELTPEMRNNVRVWIGGGDGVVGRAEVAATERALGVSWPIREFPSWGHYPSMDVPREWARALDDELA